MEAPQPLKASNQIQLLLKSFTKDLEKMTNIIACSPNKSNPASLMIKDVDIDYRSAPIFQILKCSLEQVDDMTPLKGQSNGSN